jgi:FkbM family methyltransferase
MSLPKEWLKRQMLKRDMILSKPPGQFNLLTPKLQTLKRRGMDFRMAIDGGAADGGWALEFKSVFADAQVLCIEPRTDTLGELEALAKSNAGIYIAKTLIGEAPGTIDFNINAHQSSVLPLASGENFGTVVREPVETIDRLIANLRLPPPDYIKLDLQGAELLALRGATETLKCAVAVQLEVSFIAFQKGNPLVTDVCEFMVARGFRLADIFGLWVRPLDRALAQGDFLFIRGDHGSWQETRWNEDGAF